MLINKKNLKNKIFYIYAIILASGVLIENRASDKEYILTLIFVVLEMIIFINQRKLSLSISTESKMCLVMLSLWFYGCFLGIINGNNISYIIRNFVGMILYVLYIFLENIDFNYKKLCKFILIISIFHLIITIVTYIILLLKPSIIPFIPYIRMARVHYADVYGINQLFFSSKELIHVVTGYSLYQILFLRKTKIKYVVLYLMTAFVDFVVIWTDSMKLGFLVISAAIFIVFLIKNNNIKMIFLCIPLLCVIKRTYEIYGSIIVKIFDANDPGNLVRYLQIRYVANNISFWGNGLGCDYSAIGKGYNIEVSFLDLIYKYGFVSIIIFGIYAYTLYYSIYILATSVKKKRNNWEYVMPLVLMGYLFSALSNPVLFSPLNVLLHTISLLLIASNKRRFVKNN